MEAYLLPEKVLKFVPSYEVVRSVLVEKLMQRSNDQLKG